MAEKILKIDTGRLGKSYNLNGVTKIEIKDTNMLFGTKSLNSLIKSASVMGTSLSLTLNNSAKTLLTFTNFKDLEKLPVIIYTETKNKTTKKTTKTILCTHEAGELADASLPKITPITEPQKGTNVTGSILDDTINLLNYDANTSRKIQIKIDGQKGNDSIRGSHHADYIKGNDGDDVIYASKNDDTLIGGVGNNKIYYGNDNFGDDTIILTKGENLTVIFNNDLEGIKTKFTAGKKSVSDLLITTDEGTITVKDYINKDLGATLTIKNGDKELNLQKDAIFDEVTAQSYFELSEKKLNSKYNGTAVADKVDASGLSRASNTKGGGVTVNGHAGNDIIIGSDYNDTLKGGAGDDTIQGGKGNDQLYGEGGTNTFVFNTGDGNDTVVSGKGTDILRFNNNSVSSLEFVPRAGKSYNDLVINYTKNGAAVQDSVTVKNYYNRKGVVISSVKGIENKGRLYYIDQLNAYAGRIIESTDATIDIDNDDGKGNMIIADGDTAQTINGGIGNDIIYASNSTQACTVNAGDGDDIIYGSNVERTSGNDTYYTGSGDNTVYAGNSGVTNIYLGDGGDMVYTSEKFQTNIYVDEVSVNGGKDKVYWNGNETTKLYFNNNDYDEIAFTRSIASDNLFIRYGDGNYVMLKDYFLEGNEDMGMHFIIEPQGISVYEAIEEKGGVKNYIDGIEGTDENDYILGTDKTETINAYAGNDFINPRGGNDTINLGTGNDIVIAGEGNKTINATSGKNLIKLGSGNNKVLLGTGSDTIKSGSKENLIYFQSLTYDTGNDVYQYGNGDDRLVLTGDNLSDLIIDRRGENPVLIRGIKNTVNNQKAVTIKNYDDSYFTPTADNLTVITDIISSNTESGLITEYDNYKETNLFNVSTILGDNTATTAQALTTGNGNDDVYSGFGDDTLVVGKGNNTMHMYIAEENNNNTFTRQQSDDYDTFVLEDNSNFADIAFLKNGDDLLVGYTGDLENNTVNIVDYFKYQEANNTHIIFKVKSTEKYLGDLYNESSGGDTPGGGGGDTPGGGGDTPEEIITIISSADPIVYGTPGKDDITLTGNIHQEVYAYDDDDVIHASNNSYSSTIYSQAGNDTIYGSDTTRIDGCDKYYTGPDDNIVYAGNNNPEIYLHRGNDKVYTSIASASVTHIYIDDINGTGISKNGGHDTIYWRGSEHTNLIFKNNNYSDITFTRATNANDYDLIIRYGTSNSVTIKDYYRTGNENMGNYIFIQEKSDTSINTISIGDAIAEKGVTAYATVQYGTSGADTLNGTTGNDLLYGNGNDTLNGKSGDDTYIVSSINDLTSIKDEAGTDTLKIKENLENINVLFNVQKDGTFAEWQNKLYLVSDTTYDTWKTSGTLPTSGIVIEEFNAVENISSNDNYALNNLNQLKEDVANWLTNANGGNGYVDVQTAITSGDDVSELIAIFDNANWQPQ